QMPKVKKAYLIMLLSILTSICLSENHTDGDTLRKKPNVTKHLSAAELKKRSHQTNFEFGGGVMGSVLYLSRNIKQNNDAKGLSIVANYGGNKLYRFSVQYTHYF